MWTGTLQGVARIDGTQVDVVEGTRGDDTRALYEDPDGRLWIGLRSGLRCLYRGVVDTCGTDGCSIPTYAVPLSGLARGFGKLVQCPVFSGGLGMDIVDYFDEIAHKTGTLRGVAHDVAHLTCDRGDAWLAFLSYDQHDTLVTGYEMGVATRSLLEYAGLQVTSTRSVSARP